MKEVYLPNHALYFSFLEKSIPTIVIVANVEESFNIMTLSLKVIQGENIKSIYSVTFSIPIDFCSSYLASIFMTAWDRWEFFMIANK
jgi:hypothetical protein